MKDFPFRLVPSGAWRRRLQRWKGWSVVVPFQFGYRHLRKGSCSNHMPKRQQKPPVSFLSSSSTAVAVTITSSTAFTCATRCAASGSPHKSVCSSFLICGISETYLTFDLQMSTPPFLAPEEILLVTNLLFDKIRKKAKLISNCEDSRRRN